MSAFEKLQILSLTAFFLVAGFIFLIWFLKEIDKDDWL